MNYKCVFGNHLHESESWNPGSESAQSVERENYLEQYLEEYMLISVEEGETAKEKWIVRRKPGTSGNLRARKIRRNEWRMEEREK